MVKGFLQHENINYNETFASIVKTVSYKAIFAHCAAWDWDTDHIDVKTAFFYRFVKEIIYIAQLTGLSDGFTWICKFCKALYGLKQSPQIWYKALAKFLYELEFQLLNMNLSIFTKENMIIGIYVNDLICDAVRQKINKVKDVFKAKF